MTATEQPSGGPDPQRRPVGGPTSGRLLGSGPFTRGFSRTGRALWLAVLLMVAGFSLLGVAAVLLSANRTGAVVSAAAGVVVGGLGVVLARRGRILQDVE